MENKQKTIAFWLGTVLGVVVVVFFLVTINQKINTATTTNTVTFSGEGKVIAKPDVAKLSFSIVTQATTSNAAKDANAAKSNEVTAFLKKQNIEEKDIRTSGYNLYSQQSYSITGGSPRITGYQASQNFQVTIRDLANAGKILDGIVLAGVNQVDQLQFVIDDPEMLKAKTREMAIADAKEKAGALEALIDIDLGKIINFQENSAGDMVYYEKSMMLADGRGGGNGAPSLPIGEDEIVVNVSITYQIK